MGLHRLSRADTEWVEKAVREDVARGQLVKGTSQWGFPGFPTKETAPHRAVHRKRRLVVDYRALNKVTVRKVFLIPNSDQIKSSVAGSEYLSIGDAVTGFNQVENEKESAQKMAVLIASGTYLPRGLTFGPTNGPEDFQELVFIIFARRLYREWYIFLDDLAIATGRKPATPPGPSGAHDVLGLMQEKVTPERIQKCKESLALLDSLEEDTRSGPGSECGESTGSGVFDDEVGLTYQQASECIASLANPLTTPKKVYRFLHLFSGKACGPGSGDLADELFKAGAKRGVLILTTNFDIVNFAGGDLMNLVTALRLPVSYTHLTLPTKRIV